ncbi:unnamed protein product [Clavelina lepadiformis]|uniref:Alanine--glyoxylate aminotransferase 2, mitochondrial n=1 Tax=Clavelina lepadiformis TaxID=159417 RepID=A0ABP0GBG8_CLALP
MVQHVWKCSSLLPPIRWHLLRMMSTASVPVMPECDYKPKPYRGPTYEKIMKIRSKHVSPTVKPTFNKPLILSEGKMQWLWDNEGKRYLDLFAGIVTVSVGHCHSKVVEPLKQQLDYLWHTTQLYVNYPMYEYAEKLTAKMPGNLKVCFFTNSGSEANDLAMVLAREYTKAFDIISFRNCFHGSSPYTAGLTAHGSWKNAYANGFGIHHAMNPDPYQGIWGGSNCRDSLVQTDRTCSCADDQCQAEDKYLEQLQEIFDNSIGKRVAGFFAEAIQGVGGVVQYPKNFLAKAYEMVRSRGGLCIADEVQTGFGRTGTHMWGFESHGVIPDIVTMAKGIGNGFPMGAVVTTPEVVNAIADVSLLNTFAGNPMATTVANKVLDVIEEEKTQERSLEIGNYMIKELVKLRDEFEIVGDVRGKGLMLGVEMVENKETRRPLNPQSMGEIRDAIKDLGVIIGIGGLRSNTFRIKPPMCITKEDANFAVAVVRKAIGDFLRKQ